jgi:lysophospholipase L1-like esterase
MTTRSRIKCFVLNSVIIALVSLALLALSDRLLGLVGFPPEALIQVAHPPNFREERREYEFRYTFQTNDMGLRYRTMDLAKGRDEYRVLLLGDSFTEGYGVEAQNTFGALLERRFRSGANDRKIDFINGGLSGTGPLEYWRLFHNVGLRYAPDMILICLMANDLVNMPESLSREFLYAKHHVVRRRGIKRMAHALAPRAYSILESTRLAASTRANDRRSVVERIKERARRLGIPEAKISHWETTLPAEVRNNADHINEGRVGFGLLKPNFLSDNLDIASPSARERLATMLLALNETLHVARARGTRVAMVFIPFDYQYDPGRYKNSDPWIATGMTAKREWLWQTSALQQRLSQWATENRIEFLDLTESFRFEKQRNSDAILNFPIDGHWTEAGHALAAKEIGRWLLERNAIPSP